MFYFKLIIFLLLLVFSAFFAGSESALFSLGKLRVQRFKQSKRKIYVAAKKMLNTPTRLIATLLIGNEFVNAAIGILGTSLVYDVFKDIIAQKYMPFVSVVLILPILLILGEMLPKSIGIKKPESFSSVVTLPLYKIYKWLRPISKLLVWAPEYLIEKIGGKKSNDEQYNEDIFKTMLDTGQKEGVLDSQEQSIIHNVLQLDDIAVTKIMTDREHVSFFYHDQNMLDICRHIKQESYSRYPIVHRDNANVLGVIYVKDLLHIDFQSLQDDLFEKKTVQDWMRKALFIQATANALDLFTLFKLNKMHFSIVTSKQNDFLGIVSLEDVLEEIFGDLKDERDLEEVKTWA